MKIKGERVEIIPIKPGEKEEFYELATKTQGSEYWYDKAEKSKLTKNKFFNDWNDGYFNIKSPEKGQCFWILLEGKKIGQINHNAIDKQNKKVELDIVIGDKENLGKGYGTDALKSLVEYLFENFDLNKIWIEARANNPRAVSAYQKVGFKKEGLLRKEDRFEGKFVDCVRFGIFKRESNQP